MPSYDTWLNVLTGISQGTFDQIYLRDSSGNIVDLLTLIASGGGGAGGTVSSATLPLSIAGGVLSLNSSTLCTAATGLLSLTNGQMSIDLSDYATKQEITAAHSLGLVPYVTTSTLTTTYSTTAAMNTQISLSLTPYVNNTALYNTLAAYTNTSGLTVLLAAKQNTLTQGAGISIAGNTISSTHTPIILQLDGATQTGAHTLNFVANNASISNNVVNISRMAWQDALTLRYSTSATDKDLTQGSSGELLWNAQEVQLKQNAFQQINVATPLTISGTTNITLDTLWKPSTVTAGAGIQATASDANGTLVINLDGSESRTSLKLIDSQNVVRNLAASMTGGLIWNSSQLVDLTYLGNTYTNTNTLNNSLSMKQDNISAGSGIYLNGTQVNSYGLRWNTTSTPTLSPIHELHFKGFSVTETLNLSSGLNELVINEPDKISDLVDGASGISLGNGTGAGQRIALYEIPVTGSFTAGSYFYGLGLFEGSGAALATGLGFWASTGFNLPDQFGTGGGVLPYMLLSSAGYIGIGNSNPTEKLHVTGNILATGSITAATKSFDIAHPDPAKPDMRLRHWCQETDTPGGSVQYRRTIDMTSSSMSFDMPDWFSYLVKDVIVMVTPYQHFGSAWGECNRNTIELHATTLGKWHVLIMGARNDTCATTMCPQEVEYIPKEPEAGESLFPPL
jgi:hypothetical protein